jgi:hypothetical protein
VFENTKSLSSSKLVITITDNNSNSNGPATTQTTTASSTPKTMGPSSSVEKDKTDKARTSEIFSSVTTTQIQEFLSQKTALLKEQKALVWYLFLVWITD